MKRAIQRRRIVAIFDRDIARLGALRQLLLHVDEEVLESALEAFGGAEGAASWLTRPQRGLANKVPLQVARSEVGKARILTLLGSIHYGTCP